MCSQKMPVQSCHAKCGKSFSTKDPKDPHITGFSQPPNNLASGEEPGGGPAPDPVSTSVQNVPTRSRIHSTNDSTSCITGDEQYNAQTYDTNERDAASDNKSNPVNNMHRTKKDSIVFNYSSLALTPAMESLLKRGLNFSLLPSK